MSNPSRFHLPEGGAPAELVEGSDRLDEMIARMRLALEFGMLVVDVPPVGGLPSGGLPSELVDVAVAELRKAGWTCTPPADS